MSPTSYQTAPPRVACRSSGENYHIIAPRLCQSFFSRAGHFFAARGMGGCFHGCKPRRSVVKYLRSRPRAGNARETARPFPPCQESRPPAARAVTDPGARPVLALPRPIPDGPPPLSGANKGENAFRPRRVKAQPAPRFSGRFGGPAGPPKCSGPGPPAKQGPRRKTPTGRLWRAKGPPKNPPFRLPPCRVKARTVGPPRFSGRFGGPAGPPSCNRIARPPPVVQTSRRALTAPTARFTPHLRVALGLRPNSPQG